MKVTKLILKEIVEELEIGCNCYFNFKTSEIIAIPDFSDMLDEEDFNEAFEVQLDKIKKDKKDLIKLEVPKGSESFKIMERFAGQVPDQKFKNKLEFALENEKPFQSFKNLIDNSDYRKDWFVFKQSELENLVERQLNAELDDH